MSTTPNFYELALRAAGTCHPGQENEFFARTRSLAIRIQKEYGKMAEFAEAIHRAENGGEKNGNKGWGKFQATITKVELNPKMANRAFIHYTYTDRDDQGNEIIKEDDIRTVPTSNPDGHAIFTQAQGLVGHDVIIYKRPDPDFDAAKANRNRSGKDTVGAPKTVFHIEDLGPSARATAPAQAPAQAPAPAPAPQAQAPAPPPVPAQQGQPNEGAQAAKAQLWNQLKAATPGAPDDVLKNAAVAGWAAIGNPVVAPAPEAMNQAMTVAMGEVQKAAHLAQQAQAPQQ